MIQVILSGLSLEEFLEKEKETSWEMILNPHIYNKK